MTLTRPVTRLLLVRHGETTWNVERRFQGQQDSPLTERGRWQIERLASRLAAAPLAAIYSSDLPRALTTAAAVAASHGLPVQTTPLFREGNFGDYEGLTLAELSERHGAAVRRWADDPVTIAPPNGETLRALTERVAGLARTLAREHAGQTVALVGHGGSVRAAVMSVLGLPLAHFRRLRMDNASLTIIESDGDLELLSLFNDTAHLTDEHQVAASGGRWPAGRARADEADTRTAG